MEKNEQEAAKRVRYAVVGLGPSTQAGVLPAFANAAENCELTAFVSDEPLKHKKLGKRYRVSLTYSFNDYDACLRSGEVDAVYLAVPAKLRRDFAVRAAEAGLHVICERPLGLTEEDCEAVLKAAQRKRVKVLVAYRLYQQEGNTKAIEFCRAGKIGEVRSFLGVSTAQFRPDDPRREAPGGGPLFHLGIDAVHVARKLMGAEPAEAFCWSQRQPEAKGGSAEEAVTGVLRFPGDRQATIFANLNTAESSYFHAFGSKGDLRCDPAFDTDAESRHVVTLQGKRRERTFDPREPYAPLLLKFSDSVLQGAEPSPGPADALADIRALRALERSLQEGRPVRLGAERAAAPPPASVQPRTPVRREFAVPLSDGGHGAALSAPPRPVQPGSAAPSGLRSPAGALRSGPASGGEGNGRPQPPRRQ